MRLNKNTWKRILPIVALLIFTAAFALRQGGNIPGTALQEGVSAVHVEIGQKETDNQMPSQTGKEAESKESDSVKAENLNQLSGKMLAAPTVPVSPQSTEVSQDKNTAEVLPSEKPAPVESQGISVGTKEFTCTLSISCATLLNHMDRLSKTKKELVPEDGWILPAKQVAFYEGESVFNILQRVCKQEKIHMEYENTPLYNSAYLEGIGNLYEFDAGDLSGWMYQVNDWFPNYGCSRYQPKDGDVIQWVYTCNLGDDVGAGQALSTQKG